MKILLINSDLAKNRGDRAIAEGIIQLVREKRPKAKITGISQHPERDRKWYGIDFLDMNFQTLNPIEIIRLCLQARKHDLVLWGGGEILKDYTNKTALWYWVGKMFLLSLFNSNLYGVFQGIGPTKAKSSKRLIAFIVNRTKLFITRDEESYQKLLDWGVKKDKIRHASDPAVLPIPDKAGQGLQQKLSKEFEIDQQFLDNFICIGPRDWFHYKPGGLLPFKYKKKLFNLFGKSILTESAQHQKYLSQLSDMISELSAKYQTNILLTPMHMEESDTQLCFHLKSSSADPDKVKVLDQDTLSPSELRTVISYAKAMIGFRLHSNIIGISSGVPSLNIYYVDKGRVFFDQINQSQFAMPIEAVLESDFSPVVVTKFDQLLGQRQTIRRSIQKATDKLRVSVRQSFEEIISK